jgi:nucleoside 2-deoxyribosyltransferase
MEQRWLINEAKTALESVGVNVFSPYHDVGIGEASQVAPADLAGLDACQAVLALVDGLDAGTLFEIGYARAKGKPVVALSQTVKDADLTMLRGTDCTIVDDLATAVYHAAWATLGG